MTIESNLFISRKTSFSPNLEVNPFDSIYGINLTLTFFQWNICILHQPQCCDIDFKSLTSAYVCIGTIRNSLSDSMEMINRENLSVLSGYEIYLTEK